MTLPCDENAISSLPWPLITLDFEASALDPRSYPIEVGICRWSTPDGPLEVWSTLIDPHSAWTAYGIWSEASEKVHGISLAELVDHGRSPTDTVTILNTLLAGEACYCDGGSYDLDWARKLSAASDVPAQIKLGNWYMLMNQLAPDGYARASEWMDATVTPHRAGPDAENLMRAIAIGLGIDQGPARTIN
jgi:hypothetical protein